MSRAVTVITAIFALAMPSAVAVAESAPPGEPDASPAACSLAATSETRTINDQRYLLRVPSGLTSAAPLLIALHGGGSNPTTYENQSGWTPFAARHKFIVAYPLGGKKDVPEPNRSWYFETATGPTSTSS
ncbi:hypothetical protein [Nocardia sp. BSTN01]|uniref:hypothetical protein n=1 Tax=Nocardia sp. BSTN01 TaxID=2783665 RepID=UPI001E3DC9B1|nr:hypothetical protein [Nocardia sp. BSTN01]